MTQTLTKRTENRMRQLSISKKNKELDDLIDSYAMKWNTSYAGATFRIIHEWDDLMNKEIPNNPWQLVRNLKSKYETGDLV